MHEFNCDSRKGKLSLTTNLSENYICSKLDARSTINNFINKIKTFNKIQDQLFPAVAYDKLTVTLNIKNNKLAVPAIPFVRTSELG